MGRDPLAVERAEMLSMIERLQQVVAGLRDVDAGVSAAFAEELRQLRERVETAKSPETWKYSQELSLSLLARVAVELVTRILKDE